VEFLELGGVDVDGNFMGFAGEILRGIAGDGEIEPHTDGEKKVGVLEGEVGTAGGDGAGTADIGWVAGGNQIGRTPCRHGGDSEQRAQLFELLFSMGQADAIAGEEQRALGLVELGNKMGDFVDEVGGCGGGVRPDRRRGGWKASQWARLERRGGCRSKPGRDGRGGQGREPSPCGSECLSAREP